MDINIFISSTFNDMHAERDCIRKYVIPRLKEALDQHKVNIQVTDLRWGVDTSTVDEKERESKVLHVCVDAIQKTKPYFIALLGERYGWVPSVERVKKLKSTLSSKLQTTLGDVDQAISVTEMEIQLGAIGNDNLLQHSFFCFRRYDSYEGMTDENKQYYIDKFSQDPQQQRNGHLLDQLKNRIKTKCGQAHLNDHVIEYSAKWNSQKQTFEQLEEFGNMLYNSLLDDIQQQLFKGQKCKDIINQETDEMLISHFIAAHVEVLKAGKIL